MSQRVGLLIRIDAETRQALRRESFRRAVSVNHLCNELLRSRAKPSPWLETGARAIVAQLKRQLHARFEGLVLFGSKARGDDDACSDIDLLVVLAPGIPLTRSLYDLWDRGMAGKDATRMSPHFVVLGDREEEPGSLWLEVALDGIVLFDRTGAVTRRLQQVRQAIAEGRYQRHWAHGHPYWVRT